jgi:hypothetical protein
MFPRYYRINEPEVTIKRALAKKKANASQKGFLYDCIVDVDHLHTFTAEFQTCDIEDVRVHVEGKFQPDEMSKIVKDAVTICARSAISQTSTYNMRWMQATFVDNFKKSLSMELDMNYGVECSFVDVGSIVVEQI